MMLVGSMEEKKSNEKEKPLRVALPFMIVIFIIFSLAILLSWASITRFFARLGFGPTIGILAVQKEFNYTIPSSQLRPGQVVGYYSWANDTYGNESISIIKTFKVIYPENITDLHIENETNNPVTKIQLGHTFYVSFNLTNERTSDVTRMYIVQLIDPDSKVVMPIQSEINTISPGQEEKIDENYVAEKMGTYTAQVFVWTDWVSADSPGFPIAYSKSINFDCVE